jgi:hypothetical protein
MKTSIISTLFLTVCLFLLSSNLMGQALQPEKTSLTDEKPIVLLPAENSEANLSTFSVSPTSYDFKKVCVDPNIPPQFNFAVHNNGSGTENGQVQIYPFYGFTCEGGCNYSVGPNQSKYVTIQFIPPSTGSFNATAYFTYSGGSVQAALSGEGTWNSPPC